MTTIANNFLCSSAQGLPYNQLNPIHSKEAIGSGALTEKLAQLNDDEMIDFLFPIKETDSDSKLISYFQEPGAKENFLLILNKTLKACGFILSSTDGCVQVTCNRSFWDCNRLTHELNSASPDWKRLTRILKSLVDFEFQDHAIALYDGLYQLAKGYGTGLISRDQLQEWYDGLGVEAKQKVTAPPIPHDPIVKISKLEHAYWA